MPWKKGILDRNGILKAISTFVVCGKHPVTVVEGFGFRHLMSIVCPESVNVSIRDIKRDIISSYLKERDNIKELLGKATGKVCLACENWCSEYSKDEYLCITAHFSDDDWKVHKKIVCLNFFNTPFDGSLIAEEIAICLKQWKNCQQNF
ncbi:hypothetical protein HPP92_023961 [Vanilla planifolia]|uniref:Uncharacterized protein n=1 Tax=Vanilla planifolia TaxID=51239 RepID=A0A835UCH5_VANPL|nr:hypothetical protein HPP92_023961 [Vanilla planifolia]